MSALNNLYAVQNDGGAPLILSMTGATNAVPVFAHTGRPLVLAFGNAAFVGTGGSTVQTPVAHGVGLAPAWVDIMPALQNYSGTWWGGAFGQYQAADSSNFYVACQAVGGIFASGYSYYFNWFYIGVLP